MQAGDIDVFDAEGGYYRVGRKKDRTSATGFEVWPREVASGKIMRFMLERDARKR